MRQIPFSPGLSVRELLETAGIRIRSGCRGNGACGLCLIRIESGAANPAIRSEQLLLSKEQIEGNIRFACQLMPRDDLSIRIIGITAKSNWRALIAADLPCLPSQPGSFPIGQSDPNTLGLAVDVGTTHISLTLWDLVQGIRVAGRIGYNPQAIYGADVVSRLIAAAESADNARRIAVATLDALSEGLKEMCIDNGLSPEQVTRVTVVGNTAMLILLTESDPQPLLQPSGWTSPINCRLKNPASWIRALGIHPKSVVEVALPLAGFVGSDLLAGLLATGLTQCPGSLLIDFGTNSEIALWDGAALWVTSAAGGPAFESSQVQYGMPAEAGAICHVNRHEDSLDIYYEVIGGGEAKGICGSGLVDLIACLRRSEDLTSIGRFAVSNPTSGFVIPSAGPALRLSHHDVDMFQRAKAGIGAGIATLLAEAKVKAGELNRVCVCGIFGRNLNIPNAQAIGLLPHIALKRVELCGNTALAGCERLLMVREEASAMAQLRRQAIIVNLSKAKDFETLFLENLYLQPIKDGAA
jgi:uncharacterized 2Fe-2S/4Fe-4S cluster protein (DUF4445 family)